MGRFEYFMDPEDELPRAVIPLLDAKVSTPRDIRIKKQANVSTLRYICIGVARIITYSVVIFF